jgi:hypothetical protein
MFKGTPTTSLSHSPTVPVIVLCTVGNAPLSGCFLLHYEPILRTGCVNLVVFVGFCHPQCCTSLCSKNTTWNQNTQVVGILLYDGLQKQPFIMNTHCWNSFHYLNLWQCHEHDDMRSVLPVQHHRHGIYRLYGSLRKFLNLSVQIMLLTMKILIHYFYIP